MSDDPNLPVRKALYRKSYQFTDSQYRQTTGLWVIWGVLFLLFPSLLVAQTPNRNQLTGTWIGAYTEWDIDFFCPLPIYMRLDADSTYTLSMVDGSAHRIRSTWSITDKSVRLDTIRYAPNLIRVEDDLLRIGTTVPMVFRRFQDIRVDSLNAYKQLVGRVWQSDKLVVSLFANGRLSLENLITKQRTAHFWRLAQFGSSIFLVVRGNAHNEEGPYKALWQLSQLTTQQIQMIGWNGQSVATDMFRFVKNIASGDSYQPTTFQSCSNCLINSWNVASFERPDERDTLKQAVAQQYQPVCRVDQSGLLHIQFVINCAGQIGPADIKGYGDDYCPKVFDKQLIDQFLKICQNTLTIPTLLKSATDSTTRPSDVMVSITFRLKDGQLTDILP